MNIPFPARSKTIWQLMGPSIIFSALALSGGELLLWPSLAANHGLHILWPIFIILTLQFVVNMEIERYSLVTGKSTEAHLVNNVRFLSALFSFAVIVSLVWPGWVTTGGNIIAVLFFSDNLSNEATRNVGLVISIALLALAFIVFRSKNTYKAVEKLARVGLVLALSIIIGTVILNFDGALFVEGLRGLFNFGYLPPEIKRFDFLGAVAYGGVAGVLNLVQSEWIREKKYGAASVSEKDAESIEFQSPESKKNFRSWWRAIHTEHFIVFYCANILGIFLLAYLGRLLVPIGSAEGFGVLVAEIQALNAQIPMLGTFFGLAAAVLFTMANVTILDAIGRLTSHMARPIFEHASLARYKEKVTATNITFLAIGVGIVILLLSIVIPQLKQPYTLIVLSASASSVVMWLYAPILGKLNSQLPAEVRPSFVRHCVLLLCTVFYGVVSLWALASLIPMWSVVLIGVIVTLYQLYFVFFRNYKS